MFDLNEKILFSRLQEKDQDAFAKAYDQYIDQIYRFVYFKVGNKEEAEDLTSAIFLKTWNYLRENNKQNGTKYKTIRPLLYKVARNQIIDHYRKASTNPSISLDKVSSPKDQSQDLAKQAETSSDIQLVEKKLLELKEEYREIIILKYIHELSISEIAQILDKTKGNVRVISFRALKALRELMQEEQ